MRSTIAALLAVTLVVTACGGDSEAPSEEAVAQPSAGTSPSPEAPGEGATGKGAAGRPDRERGPRKAAGGREPDEAAGDAEGGTPSGGAGSSGSEEATTGPADDATGSGPGEREGGGRLAPAPGDYVYDQEGYEEFCSTACDRRRLPRRQTISTSLERRRAQRAIVVTEARSANGGMTRASSVYTDAAAVVTEVYVRFSYSGYTFDETYRPRPPVETLRFPLRPGAKWNGTWRGRVAGEYTVSVDARETVSAAGERIEAVKVTTSTEFKGDFSGRSNATAWIDPDTKAVVRTAGNVRVRSTYGSYGSAYATTLVEGPGY